MSQANEQALLAAKAAQDDLRERLMTLAAAAGTLLISPSVEDVLPATLRLATEMVEADGYAVWRLEKGAWRIGACVGISDQFASAIISHYQSVAAVSLPFTEPLIADDVEQMPFLEERLAAYRSEGVKSMLAVPLAIRGQSSGALAFYFREPHQFTEVETQIALALGNLASAAITTAELYDAQRRIRSQSDFLAEAAAVLAKSLDYHATLKRVADLAVPHIADWCAVDLVAENGSVERLAVAHVDPRKREMAQRFHERYPDNPDSRFGPRRVIETGLPAMLEHLTDEMLAAGARSPEHLQAVRDLGVTSAMCVPLIARGRTLGAMTFVVGESGRRYDASDLQFAVDISSRAALAVDNARAYDESRRSSQLKDEFLATLSHELRTPLNAILGYARMLKSGVLEGARQTRGLEILERNATSLTQIVEDVLDVSRIISGKLALNVQPVDLPALLSQGLATMQPAADAKGVHVQGAIDPGATPVPGDADRLQQVIWNLISNAVKFTPRGEHIMVRLERHESHVEMTVSDTGIGIAPSFLPHIFERFRQADSRFSREHGGLGLGLSISRHIVEMHGGTIEASSAGLGKGASFSVKLPVMLSLAPAAVDGAVVGVPVEVPRGQRTRLDGIHVVAVDDDGDSLEMVREILEGAGAEVTIAQSGEIALDLLKRRPPEVLVCDIGMPGMDGFDLIGRVRQMSRADGGGVPAAALTAYARSEDRTRALRAGFQMHLAKPIDPQELLTSVKALASWDESLF